MPTPQESMQNLIASIDKEMEEVNREIERVTEYAIKLQQAIIKIENLQSSSGQYAAPSQQLAAMRETFSKAKKLIAGMKSKKNDLLKALEQARSKLNSDSLDYLLGGDFECIPARLTEIPHNQVSSTHTSQRSALEKTPDIEPKAGTVIDRFIRTRYAVDVYAVLIAMENHQAFIKHAVEKELIAQNLLPDEFDKLFSSISNL